MATRKTFSTKAKTSFFLNMEPRIIRQYGKHDRGFGDYFYLYNTRRPHQSLKLSDTGRGILWKEELMTIMYVIVYRAVT
jgi:transposase InsO family protein